jgi:sec-independent protein translocase protein TatC
MGPHLQRRSDDAPDDDAREGKMGFLEHLDELRTRIIRSCAAIGVGMLVAFVFHDRLADIVLAPIERSLPPGSSLGFIRPGEAFSFHLNVAFIGGVLLAAPFVMHQVWRFIAPGLYTNEKKFLIPFVVLTSGGSLCGALFSQFVLFPGLMKFYGAFSSPRMKFMPGVEDTVDLYMKMMIGMIVVFQIPTVVFFLAKMRLVTARFLWRHLKYAVLIIFILAAVLTPDGSPWNQTVVAAPMIGLYLLSIGLAWMVAPALQHEASNGSEATKLRLVFAATVIDQARRQRRIRPGGASPGRPRIRAWGG